MKAEATTPKKLAIPDLAQTIATNNGLSVSASREAITLVLKGLQDMIKELSDGDSITLAGAFKVIVREKAAGTARNPKTQEVVNVEARKKISFRPSPTLRNEINA